MTCVDYQTAFGGTFAAHHLGAMVARAAHLRDTVYRLAERAVPTRYCEYLMEILVENNDSDMDEVIE